MSARGLIDSLIADARSGLRTSESSDVSCGEVVDRLVELSAALRSQDSRLEAVQAVLDDAWIRLSPDAEEALREALAL